MGRPPEPHHAYFTTAEVAERYRVSVRTVEGWRLKGIGPRATKIGGHIRYSLEALQRFEEAAGI